MNTTHEVRVPDIGDFKDVPVIEVLVKPGDRVKKDAPLIVLESDKATLDVPAPLEGVVKSVEVKLGDKVNQGSLVLLLERAVSLAAAAPTPATTPPTPEPPPRPMAMVPAPVATATAELTMAPRPAATDQRLVRASPSLRKLGRELGVDLARVAATGPGGRLQRQDIDAFVKQELARAAAVNNNVNGSASSLPPWPQVDFAKFGPIERQPLSRIKRMSGANLARNWVTIPHVTNFDEADITDLETFRAQINREEEKNGTKLTLLAFVIKACAAALQRHPELNASLDGDSLVYKRYFHIGFAADTPSGLVVPVIRNADSKGLVHIAREVAELAGLAREGKLKPTDLQGGCFSISSLGGIGGTGFTPIINAPEVAILGITRAQRKPMWDGAQFVPRLMLPLALSWDHRVLDGVTAARFLVHLIALLGDFRRAIL
jgi:pyruvate dehydrogenase E2 component (dihydrolipoamide acetyltransferase)